EVLPRTPEIWIRAPIAAAYVLSAILYVFSAVSKSRLRGPLFVGATAILYAAAFLMLYLVPDSAVAVAVAVAGAVAGAGAFAGAVAGAFAVAGAGAFAGAVAVAVTVAGAVAVAVTVAFAVAVAFAGAGFWLQRRWARRTGHRVRALLLYAISGVALITLAVIFGTPPPVAENLKIAQSWILFMGFFPLLNALADFASTGLTRYCLRRGLNGSAWRWALWDLFGAAGIFLVLVLSLMAVAEWIRWPSGIPLMDLQGTLADIRTIPGDYWWLYVTFLSTLLPTALHFSLAVLAIGTGWFGFLRRFIVEGLTAGAKSDSMWGMAAVWVLAGCLTLSVMLPILLIGEGIPALPGIGLTLLSFFEWIAGWMARI
ncbi:MAG: hypothetical protein AAF479_10670, partial [Pseudomonadota bacterium]